MKPPMLEKNDPLIPLLRLEGGAICLASLAFYETTNQSWVLFALLFLMPDLAMVGYIWGSRVGAFIYNCTHTYLAPLLLAGIGWLTDWSLAAPMATIWIAHIGVDRAIGYGLKRRTGFKATHLSPRMKD